jgi:hypothetical protein
MPVINLVPVVFFGLYWWAGRGARREEPPEPEQVATATQ